MNVLFLDYDGVVNTSMWNTDGNKCSFGFPKDEKVNNFQAVQWISEFCVEYDFQIVVTSTWRHGENYKECLINGGLRKEVNILGKTEHIEDIDWRIRRASEIEKYLKEHPDILYYIIVDDENIPLPSQKNHFIQTKCEYGFMEPEFHLAEQIYTNDCRYKAGSFWDRVADDSLLSKLKTDLDLAAYKRDAAEELRRSAAIAYRNAELAYNKELNKDKSCETCRYNVVHEFSADGCHNLCGCEDAPCTCCHKVCESYKIDNAITSFLKEKAIWLTAADVEALNHLHCYIMQDSDEKSKLMDEKTINVIKAWRNI